MNRIIRYFIDIWTSADMLAASNERNPAVQCRSLIQEYESGARMLMKLLQEFNV